MAYFRQLRQWMFIFLFVVIPQDGYGENQYKGRLEYVRIEVEFHTRDIGLIWAYQCQTCRPVRFMFDSLLKVGIPNSKPSEKKNVRRLMELDGGAAIIVSSGANRFKAIEVWSIKAW